MSKLPLIISRILDPLIFILIVIYLGATNLSQFPIIETIIPSLIALVSFVGYFIFTLWQGQTSNYDVTDREEGGRLYAVGLSLAMMLVIYFWQFGEIKLAGYILAFVLLGTIFALITRRWKISFHAGMQGYFVAIVIFLYGSIGYWFLINIILVIWARVRGRYHTPSQAIAGGTLGLFLGRVLLNLLLP